MNTNHSASTRSVHPKRASSKPAFVAAAPRTQTHFDDLGLSDALLRTLRAIGHDHPTAIQVRAIPPALAGRDVLACAEAGTGKIAAFALPMLDRLEQVRSAKLARRTVRALVLAPTRELAAQIGADIGRYGREFTLSHAVVFGGVSIKPQVETLRVGASVVVATPDRLEDLLEQNALSLDLLEILVLDEADRMVDCGCLSAIERIVARLPRARQTLVFSATMPSELEPLVGRLLHDPVRVAVTPAAFTREKVNQAVYFVEQADKCALLERLLSQEEVLRAIVFTRTKHGADRVARQLSASAVGAAAMHGNKSEGALLGALESFRAGRLRVLVATDLAARGIDVDNITHVFNYDLPMDAESYVHRIGRTARAGALGEAVSFCCAHERPYLKRIERLIQQSVPVAAAPDAWR